MEKTSIEPKAILQGGTDKSILEYKTVLPQKERQANRVTYGWYAPGGTSLYKDVQDFPKKLFSLPLSLTSYWHYTHWERFLSVSHGSLIYNI